MARDFGSFVNHSNSEMPLPLPPPAKANKDQPSILAIDDASEVYMQKEPLPIMRSMTATPSESKVVKGLFLPSSSEKKPPPPAARVAEEQSIEPDEDEASGVGRKDVSSFNRGSMLDSSLKLKRVDSYSSSSSEDEPRCSADYLQQWCLEQQSLHEPVVTQRVPQDPIHLLGTPSRQRISDPSVPEMFPKRQNMVAPDYWSFMLDANFDGEEKILRVEEYIRRSREQL